MSKLHRNAERVLAAARGLGLEITPREFPAGTRTADDAAHAIGVSVGQIVKSLVFVVDGDAVLALVSGANLLDEAKLAAASGNASATVERADAELVRSVTGFPVGGVPPIGHATPLRVFVDEDLLAFDEVWAAAGTPHCNFAASPADLLRVTGGVVAELARL